MKLVFERRTLLRAALGVGLVPFAVQADPWVKLGDRLVSLASDHDVIPVTLLRGSFRKIKLKVKGADIFITNVTVIYSTGVPDRLPSFGLLRQGKESRAYDLRGGERHIRSIELTYRRVPNFKGLAEVTVYAR